MVLASNDSLGQSQANSGRDAVPGRRSAKRLLDDDGKGVGDREHGVRGHTGAVGHAGGCGAMLLVGTDMVVGWGGDAGGRWGECWGRGGCLVGG